MELVKLADAPDKKCIVIYRLGSIGDTIVALPCFHKIAQHFPYAERILLTNFPESSVAAPLESVLGSGNLISRCIEYGLSSRSVSELLSLRRRLRETGAETLIYLAASRGLFSAWRDLIFFRMCGFKRIIGVPLTRDLQENRTEPTTGLVEPECERLARTLAELGPLDLSDHRAWDLLLTSEEQATGDRFKEQFMGIPFIAIHVGGKAARKDWGAGNWRTLLQSISESYGGYGLLLLGAHDDEKLYEGIVPAWPSLVVNACGKLSPRECAATLRHAKLFVGHDSGPLHLASVSGTASIGLFGDYNLPRKWHPYIGKNKILHRVDGIAGIGIEAVANAIHSLAPVRSSSSS